MICVPTVQHSGSLFVVDHLFGGRDNVVFRHFGQPAFEQLFEHIDGRNIIIPLRKLKDIATSWSGRQSNPHHLDRDIKLLIAFCEKYDPYFLPIDHENRQDYLDVINEGLSLSLTTDWPVINKMKHRHCGDDFSIVDQHQWFFDKVYSSL